ncbi:MAG TPA: BamA/TamA family outer membrane protein [Puia sp.]|jgi:outer membrane protein insertion porin family|nr:BamA/TamA family outer membrane protein [Puia sp.]
MLFRRQVTVSFYKPAWVLTMVTVAFIFSCVAPKKNQYPRNKPFVFKTNIKVEGTMPNDEKQDLAARLTNQLDDSLRARTITTFTINPPFVYRKLPYPPVLNTANIARSNSFMIALLNSLGYYSPIIKDTFKIDTVKDQYRAFINFKVYPGKKLKLDSVGYDLQTPELQALALKNQKNSFLVKGGAFSKQIASSELERLINLFRNNGYYKFSIKDIYAERDTVLSALIDPTLDPFQQAQLLEDLKKKRENPTINVVIKQRPPQDSSELQKYFIDSITVFDDLPLIEDTAVLKSDTIVQNKTTVISRTDKFKPFIIFRNLDLHSGNMYKVDDYNKTLNRFGNQLGAWQRANIDFQESETADSLLNATVRLYPALKQNLGADLEASYNTNDILTETNLFGVGANVSLRNRNTFKRSILSTTTLRGGVELGANFIQTTQANLSHSISFPQTIPPYIFKSYDNRRTILNFNAGYTDRRDFFTLRSLEASFGWEGTKKKHSLIFRPIDIEYTILSATGDSLNKLLATVPSLKLAFRTGLVIGPQFIYSYTSQYGKHADIKHTDFLRVTADESGSLLGIGFINSLNQGNLFHFIRSDIEYRHHIDYKRTELAFRAYAGYGLEYGNGKGTQQTLPFYKAFYAGGPNSMRGWQVRQLGLGSSHFYDTSSIDKFGDIKIESNIEYRFPLGTLYGIKLKSALYVDAGNIWNRNISNDTLMGSDFAFNRFYKEFAVDAGTGLRLDFDYFVIRFDWAYIIRDPRRLDFPDRWFYDMQLKNGQFQLGIGYPF